uniref:Uncharacterized protein n=1 Tax=Anguilla anguilla TaxID=7936 RepID=A0A0E9TSW1_ANGAN
MKVNGFNTFLNAEQRSRTGSRLTRPGGAERECNSGTSLSPVKTPN